MAIYNYTQRHNIENHIANINENVDTYNLIRQGILEISADICRGDFTINTEIVHIIQPPMYPVGNYTLASKGISDTKLIQFGQLVVNNGLTMNMMFELVFGDYGISGATTDALMALCLRRCIWPAIHGLIG